MPAKMLKTNAANKSIFKDLEGKVLFKCGPSNFFSKAKDKSGSTTRIFTLVKSICSTWPRGLRVDWCNDTQHNNKKCDIQHNDTVDTVRLRVANEPLMLSVVILGAVMLNVAMISVVAPMNKLAQPHSA